jgi:tetratricopeptide (TPR) repeat protein
MLMFTTVVKEFPGSEGDVVSRLKMAILGEESEVRRKLELINSNYSEFLDSEKGYLYLLEHHPESLFTDIARLDLGRLYFEKGEYEKSRLILGQMLDRRLEPGLREAAFTNLRKVIYAEIEEYFIDKKFDLIVYLQNEYGKDFLSRPSAVYPFLWIAVALHREGFNVGALNAYREIKRLKPKAGEAQIVDWGIADLLVKMGRYDEAEEFLSEVNFKRLQPLWRVRMRLLRVHIQIHRGQESDAFSTLRRIKKELPGSAVKERVETGTLETDLQLRANEPIQALDTLRAAVSLAFVNPREIEAAHRQLLGYRLARMLYEEKEYGEALSWFSKLALLTPTEELAELIYWQLRCEIALGREVAVAALVKRLQNEFPDSPWTASAATASKDFIWRQEKNSLK